MAVALTQVITEDRASGAQVIDGSLKFNGSSYLTRTPSGAGNRTTWTWSGWIKRSSTGRLGVWSAGITFGPGSPACALYYNHAGANNTLEWIIGGSADGQDRTNAYYRDYSSWHHVVGVYESSHATASERFRLFVNGERVTCSPDSVTQNYQADVNNTVRHTIGARSDDGDPGTFYDGYMSQVYFVDGQALDASYFGFTDSLTNTWRPKKYTGTYGTNGFYLPMDGNSPIGEDKSGNGNDWTPVNFGGSNTIEKATGALPILNTVNGGNIAAPGVFGSKVSKTLTTTASTNTSNGFVFANEGTKPTLSFVRGATYIFDYSASTAHPLRFATAADAVGSTEYTDGTDTSVANTVKITVPHNAPDTLYYYCTNHGGMGNSISVTTDEKVADPYAWKCVLALPLIGSTADVSNQINSTRTALTFSVNGGAGPTTQSNFYGGSYTFDGTADSVYSALPNSDALFLQNSNFTMECWARIASGQTDDRYFLALGSGSATNADGCWSFRIYNSKFQGIIINGNTQYVTTSVNNYVPDKWTHIAFVREGNVQRLYINGILERTEGYTVLPNLNTSSTLHIGSAYNYNNTINAKIQDVRIYDNVAKYTSNFIPASTNPDILPDTPSGVAGGSALTKITEGAVSFGGNNDFLQVPASEDLNVGSADFTAEAWVYPTTYGEIVGAFNLNSPYNGWLWSLSFDSAGGKQMIWFNGNQQKSTSVVPLNKWSHIAFSKSGTTVKYFLDGKLDGSFTASADSTWSNQVVHIGADSNSLTSPTRKFGGYISNLRLIKGTALYTSDFTPPTRALTNVTNTKLLCCQSNTSATAAAVTPGSITANGNAQATNFNPFTTDINTVRGQETGYATLNPLIVTGRGTISNGNLDYVSGTDTLHGNVAGSFALPTSGKWYWEVTSGSSTNNECIGVANILNNPQLPAVGSEVGSRTDDYIYRSNGVKRSGGALTSVTYGTTFTSGDVIGVMWDSDNGTIGFSKNGIYHGTAYSSITQVEGKFVPAAANAEVSSQTTFNFGQKPFKYNPPEGFKTLCLANLPRPTKAAVIPDKYFNTVLYTGNATSREINVGFAPDFVWLKRRGTTSEDHVLANTVVGANAFLSSNLTSAENTASGCVTGFTNNGFTVGTQGVVNDNNQPFVAWCWKAGGDAVSNTDGSITSQVSANQDAGFSIVTYTGTGSAATVGHGLGVPPDFMVIKCRNKSFGWTIYHQSLGNTRHLEFAATTGYTGDAWNSTNPTSTVFSLGTDAGSNNGSSPPNNYVAYCFAEVEGYSKFGSYTGNASTDGPFVYCGFKPAFVLLKPTSADYWMIFDTARTTYNPVEWGLFPNDPIQETYSTSYTTDLLSNGFKLRTSAWPNRSSTTIIFAAFAEAPTNNLFGGQANAR